MQAIVRTFAALCLSGTALLGCADGEFATAPVTQALASEDPGAPTGQLRFVHASATSAALDIYAGTAATPLWTGVSFGTATGYLAVPAGELQLVFRPAGASADATPVHTSDVLMVAEGESVTSLAGGLLGSSLPATKFRVQAYVEGFAAAEPGRTRVRFVQDSHALASAGFDLGADGSIEVAGLAAFTASEAAGVATARSNRPLQLALMTGTPAKRLTAFTLPPELLAQDGGLFLALVGVPTFVPRDPRGLALLVVGPGSATLLRQNPTVFLLPAIPDAAGIDAYALGRGIAGGRVAENVGFGALAPALQLPPTASGYGLFLTASAAGGDDGLPGLPLAFEWTGPLVAGERYLAVASGFAQPSCSGGRTPVRVTLFRDAFDTKVAATGRLRALAAAADAPVLDVGQFAPGEGTPFSVIAGLEGLGYETASAEAGVVVAAAPLNPGVRPAGSAGALRFRFGALSSVERAFGVVAGAFAPATADVGARFIVVKAAASGAWTAQTLTPQP